MKIKESEKRLFAMKIKEVKRLFAMKIKEVKRDYLL